MIALTNNIFRGSKKRGLVSTMKRITAFIITLAMTISLLPVMVYADMVMIASEKCEELTFSLEQNEFNASNIGDTFSITVLCDDGTENGDYVNGFHVYESFAPLITYSQKGKIELVDVELEELSEGYLYEYSEYEDMNTGEVFISPIISRKSDSPENEGKKVVTYIFKVLDSFEGPLSISISGSSEPTVTYAGFPPGNNIILSGFLRSYDSKYYDIGTMTATVNFGSSVTTSSYTASFGDPTPDSVAPGEEFTVPVFITSDDVPAAAELDLKATNATIEAVDTTEEGSDLVIESANAGLIIDSVSQDKTTMKLTFCGNTASAETGLKVATVTLKALEEGSAGLVIQSGKAAKSGETGYTEENGQIVISDGTEMAVSDPVSVTVAMPSYTVSVNDYVSGVTLVKCTAEGSFGSYVPQYGSQPMIRREVTANGATTEEYLYLVQGSVEQATAEGLVSLGDSEGVDLSASLRGDVNGSNVVSIVDVQVAYDIAKGVYPTISESMSATTVDMPHWLMADANFDGIADALDARGIQIYLHTGEWN